MWKLSNKSLQGVQMDSWLRLSEIASMANGELKGEDAEITGISTDTRDLHFGDLFIALEGEKFDGHQFIDDTIDQIVSGALIHKEVMTTLPLIVVDNTLAGMSRWANAWRKRVDPKLVAITGSNGKTTVKQMISNILVQVGSTCATKGNLNNHIGVPLTLLTLREKNKFAVIEMGANHFGEINHLSLLAEPEVAVITNAGPAHLEGFGSIAGVAQAKGEIIDGVREGGTVVLNSDDSYLDVWLDKAKKLNVMTFGFCETSTVKGEINEDQSLSVRVNDQSIKVNLPLPGKHNAYNALASVAVAIAFNVDIKDIKKGLENADQVHGRLQLKQGMLGATIIDDTYNANPASLQAAIDVLCSQEKEPWLVLGDMGELGEDTVSIHAHMGEIAKAAGVKKLFGLGELAKQAVDEFGENGYFFNKHDVLSRELLNHMNENCCILIKGSRTMHMEDVVNFLIESKTVH